MLKSVLALTPSARGFVGVLVVTAAFCSGANSDLKERISVEAAGTPLSQVLPELGKAAGERVRSGKSLEARKVYLFCNGITLDGCLSGLQMFLPKAPGTCARFRTGNTIVLEEDLLSRERRIKTVREQLRKEASQRGRDIAAAEAAAEDRAARLSGDRGAVRRADWYRLFGAVPGQAAAAALQGAPTRVPFSALGSEGQDIVRRWEGKTRRSSGGQLVFDGAKDLHKVAVHLLPIRRGEHAGLQMNLDVVGAGSTILDLTDPSYGHPSNIGGAKSPPRRPRGPADRATQPQLQPGVTLQSGPLRDVLKQLADQAHLPVFGDYDPGAHGSAIWHRREQKWVVSEAVLPAGQVVRQPVHVGAEEIAQHFNLTWEFRQGWLVFRSPNADAITVGLLPVVETNTLESVFMRVKRSRP